MANRSDLQVDGFAALNQELNEYLIDHANPGQFATFFLGWIDERTLRLRYTNAGHNQPLHLSNGTRRLLDVGGTVVGMMETLSWEEAEIALAPGDRLLLYTDGVTEAMNAAGEMYGEDRLYALADSLPVGLTASAMVEGVLAGLGDFLSGAEPGDDVTIMALRVLDVP